MPSDFKMCLHKLLYYKDCISTRQSCLCSFYIVVNKNNKKDKKKLENITIVFYSITYYHPFLCYTTQDGLPLFPNDPAFTHFYPETIPSTSGSTSKSLPLNAILERPKAARQCLEEESKAPTSSKHCVKQGPIKKSKKQRDK